VRQLLDSAGEVQTNYAYDPFGVPVVSGDASNPYRFTGEAWDEEVELLYLRARYYQPEMGRFITKDPCLQGHTSPAALNLYLYAADNPVNMVDHNGLQSEDPDPQPSATPTAKEIEHAVVEDLSSLYGMYLYRLSRAQGYHETLASEWEPWQLDLIRKAAGDFAYRVEGGAAGVKARIASVAVFKAEGALKAGEMPARAYAAFGHTVVFSGNLEKWKDIPGQKWTVVHELAHVWDAKSGLRLSAGMVAVGKWRADVKIECSVPGKGGRVLISDVTVGEWREGRHTTHLNPREDWAEAVAAYVYPDYAGSKDMLKEISEPRWYYVAEKMNPSNPERHLYPDGWDEISFVDAAVGEDR
jgi:RHS repeat-associated protein